MKWTVVLLIGILTCFTQTVADQYDPQTYSDPYQHPVIYRRHDFDLFGDGGSLGIIGIGAIAGIIAGGVAVAKAANERTAIQNDINALSTRANTLQTSADAVSNTLMTAQTTATTDNTEATALCSFLDTVRAINVPAAAEMDNTDAINSIINAAMSVTCVN